MASPTARAALAPPSQPIMIFWRNDSVPEVVTDHVSGVFVDSLDAAVAAVRETATMSRTAVREEFEARFTVARMARNYDAAYRSILAGASSRTEFAAPPRSLILAWEHPALQAAGVNSLRSQASDDSHR
jgi:hypothetical protein